MRYAFTVPAVQPSNFPITEFINDLSNTARLLYSALKSVAEIVKEKRGYHPNTSQVTFFCPLEAVALAIGVTRQTVYNHLPGLVEKGLVAQRGHFCTYNGSTRSDGSLWSVKLDLDCPGKAKIDFDWLRKSHRDLGADIAEGKTAFKLLQSYPRQKNSVELSYVLSFALPPSRNPITYDCKEQEAPALECLLDVPYTPTTDRSSAVDSAAKAISSSLGSSTSSLNFWRWLVWALLRLEQHNKSYFYQVFLILQRAKVDKDEGSCRNAAALAVSRLKSSPIWNELKNAPQIRVGIRPKNASP